MTSRQMPVGDFQPFLMERAMSKYEQTVEYNLSESGVHPITVGELIDDDDQLMKSILSTELTYPHVNGTPQLRTHIAALYGGANPENVLVTVGGIEANYLAIASLLSPGDEMIVMIPNYLQVWGLGKNLGVDVKTFALDESRGWAPDLTELSDKVTSRTKLIAVCNPNNPTGRILTDHEMDVVAETADSVGAWILSDEVYRGAERSTDLETPSFYGRAERVVAVGSMSKAYGMPGLRLGWAVAPRDSLDEMWARHEYLTISASSLSNLLATHALSPEVRPRLVERTRRFIRDGYPNLEGWLSTIPAFETINHQASAVALLRYKLGINSTELANRIRVEKSVLVVPGDHFGMDHSLRVSFGLPPSILLPALERVGELMSDLADSRV